MIKYMLAIGLTDTRFQKLGNYCSTSRLNFMAVGSCTSEEKTKQRSLFLHLHFSALLCAYINSKCFLIFDSI